MCFLRITQLFIFVLVSNLAFSQSYDDLSSEVRSKMDENKILGIDVYTGIETKITITPMGLEADEHQILIERATQVEVIKNIEFISDGLVEITCKGGTSIDPVKRIFSDIVSGISSYNSDTYILLSE